MGKPNQQGATFAERAAAARGDKDFVDPRPAATEVQENSSFATRAKAVKVDDAAVEDKAVKKAASSKKS